ncbi:MAG TPA: DsbA family protein [Candidatus Thermoplasmatota archaeon]|nr:DsbA family protein [Candidatus Thermoplasmatota archaeon]
MPRLRAYFTFSSSYSYLAWQRVTHLHPERYAGVDVEWVPVNFLRLSELQGLPPKPPVPHQLAYNARDAKRWADAYGVPFLTPERRFGPTQDAVKGHLMAEDAGPELAAAWRDAVFSAYRVEGRDLSDRGMLASLAQDVGLPDYLARLDDARLEERLERNTREAFRAGAPGVPYFVIDGDGYWGNDRLAWVEARLSGQRAPSSL